MTLSSTSAVHVPEIQCVRHCVAYEVPFQLRGGDQFTIEAMLDVLPFGTEIVEPVSAAIAYFSLPQQSHSHWPSLFLRLEQQVLLHVAVHAPYLAFIHAGVVGWRGRAILFPGRSCAGKTTLVAELVKLGAVYYSDEYALLDSSGRVHPYPRDLRMRKPGSLHQTKVSPRVLSGQIASTPAVVAQIVFTEFVLHADWNPQPLTPGLAILETMRHCVAARRKPDFVLATLKTVMQTAQSCRSVRGDAKTTAELLLQAFDSGPLPA